ncbi:Dor1-domain-containing protein [Basidiobolus meristosporus CBS 931.73]|uniref:Conserved oligomeric Golgi complex subunit 8 n=1 Tax=Basidiobolus meristosporus CBS 931.73 TaxID=1314790 RepID=A0A1Y1XZ23_9FUNG|nr:Dor1-domain-containing protein [Basidiobolus meristosporus CBS 931.73]|eukprot:ORX91000.1 Dor1-domain-containing protein [Basidiobolus meristosporus CBS 931.73]
MSEVDDYFHTLIESTVGPSQKELVKEDWCKEYLDHLTGLSLNELREEPVLLEKREKEVTEELKELAKREYLGFVSVYSSSETVSSTLSTIDHKLNSLLSVLPSLEKSYVSFNAEVTSIQADRSKLSLILNNYNNLLEVLEIPQLIDTCVRNGYYAEALELSSHVRRLCLRHPTVDLLEQVSQSVEKSIAHMLSQLLVLLRGPIKLPLCLRVIGFLRRMEVFDEAELRVLFLKSRDAYFEQLVHELSVEMIDPVKFLRRYIDLCRDEYFDIVSQYQAIFAEEDLDPNERTSTKVICSDYISQIVVRFTATLTKHTSAIHDISALSSLLTQAMFCGMSLGRIGLDFRQIIGSIFERRVSVIVKELIVDGTEEFQREIEEVMKKNVSWLTNNKALTTEPAKTTSRSVFAPPTSLVNFPPLARLTNAFLSAFNSLRLLAPISIMRDLSIQIDHSLMDATKSIQSYAAHKSDIWSSRPEEKAIFERFCELFVNSFIPYIKRCFVEGVYADILFTEAKARDILPVEPILEVLGGYIKPPANNSPTTEETNQPTLSPA